jgi:hypothetical protein
MTKKFKNIFGNIIDIEQNLMGFFRFLTKKKKTKTNVGSLRPFKKSQNISETFEPIHTLLINPVENSILISTSILSHTQSQLRQ